MEKSETTANCFGARQLPWLIGAGGLLVYLLTLNHWLALLSLGPVARLSGWLWQPDVGHPLTLLVFSPFRLLPESWRPLALNIFTAICASLVLGLLARSVMLLRHDVAPADRLRKIKPGSDLLALPAAWLPPVLAAIVCGLQLTFWEHATSATGEMLGLLCFAYTIRCLLEFRINPNPAWLWRAAGVYAAGMTDNWLLVGYLPVFLAALIWLKGLSPCLSPHFLWRLAGWGLLGLSLYLLLPTLLSWSAPDAPGFWALLKAELRAQKQALTVLRSPPFRLLALLGLAPFLILAVRWKSHSIQFADDTRLGVFLVKVTGHFIHGLFFVLALWIALNPVFTPRNLDVGAPLLPYYYLWALVAGYGAGYFLLFGAGKRTGRWTRLPATTLTVLLGLMSAVLLWKNLDEIRTTNGPAVHDFARALSDDLPPGQSVVLSDEPQQLRLLCAELAGHSGDKNPMLVETPALVSRSYQRFLARRYPSRWPEPALTNQSGEISPDVFRKQVSGLAEREPVLYQHPSAGFFFESFADVPNGSMHRLVPWPAGRDEPSPLADAVLATNELIWQRRWDKNLSQLANQIASNRRAATARASPAWRWLRLSDRLNVTAAGLGGAYSKSLNYWGVQLQRAGRPAEAREWFRRALELNPDNLSAHINLTYATSRQQGNPTRLTLAGIREQLPELFGKYGKWWTALNANGPVDEPTFLQLTGRVLLATRNPRQAGCAFARCAELLPDWLLPRLGLTQSRNLQRNFAGALELTAEISSADPRLTGAGRAQLLLGRVTALRGLGRTNEATLALESGVREAGTNRAVLTVAANLYAVGGEFERALELRDTLLQGDPNNPQLLVQKGLTELRLARTTSAVVTLNRAVALAPGDNQVRLYRAAACLTAGQLEVARADFKELLKQPGREQSALFALGGIAWREHDTNAVIQYYQQYLSNSAAWSPQHNVATERLKQVTEE